MELLLLRVGLRCWSTLLSILLCCLERLHEPFIRSFMQLIFIYIHSWEIFELRMRTRFWLFAYNRFRGVLFLCSAIGKGVTQLRGRLECFAWESSKIRSPNGTHGNWLSLQMHAYFFARPFLIVVCFCLLASLQVGNIRQIEDEHKTLMHTKVRSIDAHPFVLFLFFVKKFLLIGVLTLL